MSKEYDAAALLEMECCQAATAVERMAHRWYLVPSNEPQGQPCMLIAPRFARVPSLRVDCPAGESAHEVYVTGFSPYGWFSHLRVSYPGGPPPVTVASPVLCGRPGYEDRMRESGRPQSWKAYALTAPAGASHIEISKTEAAEACLVSVEFRPNDDPATREIRAAAQDRPMVIGITDMGGLAAETLQAYETQVVREFYQQMKAMGFTHLFQQVYGGSASWSRVARPHGFVPHGHMPYANWNEPANPRYFTGHDNVDGFQADIDDIHEVGMKMVASFRINNEWLADWAKEYAGGKNPVYASQFSIDHPELWMTYKSGGRHGGGLDFAFREVRAYRRDIIAEWCDKFSGFDGICIDVHRHPPMVSYPEHLVQQFREATGIDVRTVEPIDQETLNPDWLKLRAESFTEFIRMVRELLRARCGDAMQLSARVGNTFERALFEGVDLAVWIQEKLVDLLVLQHRPPANPPDADTSPIIAAAHAAGIKVVHLFGGWDGVDFVADDLAPVRPRIETWRDWGSDGIGFYEAERIGRDGRWIREMPDLVEEWGLK